MSLPIKDSFLLKSINYFILFVTVFFIIYSSPKLLSEIQPDSLSYIEFNNTRNSLYTILINFCRYVGLDLILFQVFLLSFSIVFLFFSMTKLNDYLSTLFIIFILSNIYYTSFTHTYLTESIFFSFINIATGLCFYLKQKNKIVLFLFGLSLGVIFSIKTIGFIISLPFLFFSFLLLKKNKAIRFFIIVFIGLLIPILSEIFYFYLKHENRNTVFPTAVFGKVFFLSGKNSFKIDSYPEKYREILGQSKKMFSKPNDFLDDIKNPILTSDLTADYEVIAQYQFLGSEKLKKFIPEQNIINESYYNLLFFLLKNNFGDYLKLSFSHYIGMWSTGAKYIFLDAYTKKKKVILPLGSELKNSSGPMDIPDNKILLIAQFFFIFLFFLFIFTTISYFYLFYIKKNFDQYVGFLALVAQVYLITVSFTNIATIRYLMPVYPLILISTSYFTQLFYSDYKKKLKVKI